MIVCLLSNSLIYNKQQQNTMVLLEFGSDIFRQIKNLKDSYVPVNYKPQPQNKQSQQLRETIFTTLANPLKIQYYFWLWFVYSFYAVVKMIVFIPFQLIIGIFNSLLSIFHICFTKYISFFAVMTLIVCYIFQQQQYTWFDPSYMYHLFRGQSTLKLYGLIFAIQVSEKISTMVGKYLYSNIKTKLQNPTIQLWRVIPEMLACFAYTIVHAYCIFLQYNIFMVVINGSMQNFIIFIFVTNLTKMKSTAFKKFDSKSYLGQINFDAKDRLHKSIYLIMFQISQWDRQIPDISTKLFFIYIFGAIIEHIKHITVLIQCGQISQIDKIRNTMFYKMYVNTDDRTFLKCLNNDFTVIPFTVFFVKMVRLVLYVNYNINNQIIVDCYFKLCLLLLIVKLSMIAIRKINILDSPTQLSKQSMTSLKLIGEVVKASNTTLSSLDLSTSSKKKRQ